MTRLRVCRPLATRSATCFGIYRPSKEGGDCTRGEGNSILGLRRLLRQVLRIPKVWRLCPGWLRCPWPLGLPLERLQCDWLQMWIACWRPHSRKGAAHLWTIATSTGGKALTVTGELLFGALS